MKRHLVLVGVWLVMLSRALYASESTSHVFPQFVDGRFGDGTYYRTTVMLTNMFAADATCTWTLKGMTATLDSGESGSTFSMTIPSSVKGQSPFIRSTTGTQAFQHGYATVSCNAPVFAAVIYGYYASNGTKLSEATVTDFDEFSLFVLPVDERENAKVAIALANNTNSPVEYAFRFLPTAGTPSDPVFVTVDSKTHMPKFVDQIIPGLSADARGLLLVNSDFVDFSLIGLRFTGLTFTMVPAYQAVWR